MNSAPRLTIERIIIPGPMYGRWAVVRPDGSIFGVYEARAEALRVANTPGVA